MSIQVGGSVIHRHTEWALGGISIGNTGEFVRLGFRLVSASTSRWQGYVAHYSIIDDYLFLTSISAGISETSKGYMALTKFPILFDSSPVAHGFGGFPYDNFQDPILFTGSFLLGRGFLHDRYRQTCFNPAWHYENVRAVKFDSGKLLDDTDCSLEIAQSRNALAQVQENSDESSKPKERNWSDRLFYKEC